MNEKQKIRIDRFIVSWAKLNQYLTAFECEKRGIPYRGFLDPEVQRYWKTLKKHEQRELMKKYHVSTEEELAELFC